MPSGENPNSAKNLKKWGKGVATNPQGKKPGTLNRSTIARKVLEMSAIYPDAVFEKLKAQYPRLEKTMSVQEMMSVVMADKAIKKQDVNAYKALMDSGYGLPMQEVDILSGGEKIALPPITFIKKET